jgi:hypothetical protein
VVAFTSQSLYLQYPVHRRLGQPQTQYGQGGEKKKKKEKKKRRRRRRRRRKGKEIIIILWIEGATWST